MSENRVLTALRKRIAEAQVGSKLPTVRALIDEFSVSQAVVQGAIKILSDQGLVRAHVGRGTFVSDRSAKVQRPPTVLILSARTQNGRNHRVADLALQLLSRRGARCLQVVYDQLDDAMEALDGGLNFDVVILQSHLETVPLRLLNFLQKGERSIIIDGSRLSGIDVDIVSSNWPSALDLAIRTLRDNGHRRIGFVTLPSAAKSAEGLRQHFDSMRRWAGWDASECPLIVLDRSPAIGERLGPLVRDALRRLQGANGSLPFTALAIWCGNDAAGLTECLHEIGLLVPDDLSILMVGHVDVESEHLSRLAIAGPRTLQAAELLTEAVFARAADPFGEVRTVYVDSVVALNESVRDLD